MGELGSSCTLSDYYTKSCKGSYAKNQKMIFDRLFQDYMLRAVYANLRLYETQETSVVQQAVHLVDNTCYQSTLSYESVLQISRKGSRNNPASSENLRAWKYSLLQEFCSKKPFSKSNNLFMAVPSLKQRESIAI